MGPHARINLDALRHNLQRARDHAPNSKMIAVIKANAYGHGLLQAASALADADALGVARVEEAVTLREAGVQGQILVLEGYMNGAEYELANQYDLDVAIHQLAQLDMLEQSSIKPRIGLWLKFDSGMHRLGFQSHQVQLALSRLQAAGVGPDQINLMSHFSSADDVEDPSTEGQIALFQKVSAGLSWERSLSNSAGILAWPDSRLDWCRPGIMLYGASPMLGKTGADHGLQPVMTLSTTLLAINRYQKGEPVGYGGSWHCPEQMSVGTIAIGYGDGYPRHAPVGTPVLLNGCRVPLVGRVSMDMVNIDLRSQPNAQIGDPVVLWGEGLPAEEIAEQSGTIAYELFCGVTQRVVFEYEGGQG